MFKKTILAAAVLPLILMGCQNVKPLNPQQLTVQPVIVNKAHAHKAKAHAGHQHSNHAHWGYGEKGTVAPEFWGDVEVNKLCKSGQQQSPINITKVVKPVPNSDNSFDLTLNYVNQDFDVVNNGHTIVFNAKDDQASTLYINNKPYKLLQFHYHVPSEHTVMNTQYPLEIHFVHKHDTGVFAVVGVLVNAGMANPDLQRVITDLPQKGVEGVILDNFNVSGLIPKDSKTFAYDGSLTTPPCSEKVQWLLKQDPISASPAQLGRLAQMYNGNNRPIQSQGDRKVYYVD